MAFRDISPMRRRNLSPFSKSLHRGCFFSSFFLDFWSFVIPDVWSKVLVLIKVGELSAQRLLGVLEWLCRVG